MSAAEPVPPSIPRPAVVLRSSDLPTQACSAILADEPAGRPDAPAEELQRPPSRPVGWLLPDDRSACVRRLRRRILSTGGKIMTHEEPGHRQATDMSVYEALFADAPDPRDESGGVCSAEPPWPRPRVEWAIAWTDGHVTAVPDEEVARYVAARNPAWRVVCRMVGAWGPA